MASSDAQLARRHWPEVEAGVTLLLPLGSTEQHGPHLPLDTDTRIADAIADGAAGLVAGVVVAPALAYGASGEHDGFAGTLSIGTSALRTVLVELVRSAGHFARVVFVNGHGGNHDAIAAALTLLHDEGRDVRAWWPRLPGADAHAGLTETSLMLAIDPSTVSMDLAEPGPTDPLHELLPRLRDGGVQSVSSNGVLGDPTGSTAEHGRELLGELVGQLVEVLTEPAS